MFDFLFGWTKASKCKKVIERARCRLKLLKNKKHAIVRQSREDVVELIKSGRQETAVNRVEQLIKDESLAAAYEILDDFCEFILTQLFYIRRNKDCPNDINEAVSSIIYASARCGDLPELCVIRKLFGERYGEKFAAAAVELFPGNLVNNQLKESLSEKSVPDDLKYRVVDEIARDYCLQPELLAIEYYPDWQQVHCVDSSVKNFSSKPSDPCSLRESNIANTSAMLSTVQQYPPYTRSSPSEKKMEKVGNFANIHSFTNFGLKYKGERMGLASSAETESLPPYPEEIVEYCDYQSDLDQHESQSEKSSTRSFRKSKRVTNKRSRRRSASLENQGIMDIGCMVYYHKPCRSPSAHKTSAHYSGKHHNPLIEAISQTSYGQKRLKQHSYLEMERNLKSKRGMMNGCSLDHPCYFYVYTDDEEDCLEALPVKPKREIRAMHIQQKVLFGECCHCQPFWNEESKKVMKLVTIPQRPNRRSYSGAAVYNVFTYPDCQTDKQKNETKRETPAPYSRAVTMPTERHNNCRDQIIRTYSCPSQYPNHVHPKLPDYDDIAAKFTALKKERLENEDYCSGDIQLE